MGGSLSTLDKKDTPRFKPRISMEQMMGQKQQLLRPPTPLEWNVDVGVRGFRRAAGVPSPTRTLCYRAPSPVTPSDLIEPGSSTQNWYPRSGSCYCGCFKGVSKSVQVLFNSTKAVMVLTLIMHAVETRKHEVV